MTKSVSGYKISETKRPHIIPPSKRRIHNGDKSGCDVTPFYFDGGDIFPASSDNACCSKPSTKRPTSLHATVSAITAATKM